LKKIIAKQENCIGCGLCEVACTVQHSKSKDTIKAYNSERPRPISRVRLEMITGNGTGMLESDGFTGNIRGEIVYMTNSLRMGWINNLRADVDGKVDMKEKEISMKIYLAMKQQAATPAM